MWWVCCNCEQRRIFRSVVGAWLMNQIQLKCLVHSNGCRCLRCLQRAYCACICVLMRDVLLHVRKTQPIALQTKQHTSTEPSHCDVIFRFLCVVMHISIYPCLYIYMLNIQRSISNVWNTIATSNVHSIVFEIAVRSL